MRFYVSPDRLQAVWCHQLEAPMRCPDWIDCTDMDDDQFGAFMGSIDDSKKEK